MKDKIIFHCDLDCFYASVEMVEVPWYKGKKIAICGDIEKRHGIILAKSYEAKAYGIKTGMPLHEAKSLCPDILFVNAHFDLYKMYSQRVREIYLRYSDLVEPFGLDENWIDVTGSLHLFENSPMLLAKRIQNEILMETGLTVSIGIGWNKIIAKFGSDYNKPFGITEITHQNMKEIFWNAPAEDLLYVGRKTKIKYNKWGLYTIGDIALDVNGLLKRHGNKVDNTIMYWAKGYDSTPVSCEYVEKMAVKSVGNSITTVKDMDNYEDAKLVIQVLSESIATRLKRNGQIGSVISIYVRSNDLQHYQAQHKIERHTDVSEVIIEESMKLLYKTYDFEKASRSIGISVSGLKEIEEFIQGDIFGEIEKVQEYRTIDIVMDSIRSKFGHEKIMRCSKLTNKELTDFNPLGHDIHPVGYFNK